MSAIWLPGAGMVDLAYRAIHKAVQEYDERLSLGMNQDTGQWTVYYMRDRGEEPFPVLALPPGNAPDPQHVVRQLWEKDSLRHGEKLLDDINRRNEEIRVGQEKAAIDGAGAAAEALEWGFRQKGFNPFPRIFVPKGV